MIRTLFRRPLLSAVVLLALVGGGGAGYAVAGNDLQLAGAHAADQVSALPAPAQRAVAEQSRAERADAEQSARAERTAQADHTAQLKAEQLAPQQAAEAAAAAEAARQVEAARQAAAEQASRDAVRDPRSAARMMLGDFGWGSGQFSCLSTLWDRESGWDHTADNPRSSAYGIPQALPGSKMSSAGADWRTNPVTQIRWGLGYIESSYGSPCSALAHSSSNGWY